MSPHLDAAAVARSLSAELTGNNAPISAPAPIQSAAAGELSFAVDVERYGQPLASALQRGVVVIVPAGADLPDPAAGALIPVPNPRAAFAQMIAAHFTEGP